MNQEQNNLNPNNFSMQDNNGIPNNQPLNNQSFNQGMGFNHQSINPQPQPTPNLQQPINQMNIGQQTPQPTINNTLESGNANNQSFNSKPPKKMNLGLIIGIVAVVVVVVVGIVFGSKLLSNDENSNNSINSNNTQNNKETEKLINNNENIISTSYVDSYNKLVIEYPTFYFDGDSSAMRVTSYVNKPIVEIGTIIGNIYIAYPAESNYNENYSTAKDFYNNYLSSKISDYCNLNAYISYIESPCDKYSLKDNKNIGSYKFNNLNWERYEINFVYDNSKKEYELWITVKNNVPYMVIVETSSDIRKFFDNIAKVSDNLWKKINDNRKSIMEYMIKNIKFIDNKEELFAYKEASVLLCEGSWDASPIFKVDFKDDDKKILAPNCRTNLFRENFGGRFVGNENNIAIDDVYGSLKQLLSDKDVFREYFYVESEEESYQLNNSTMGDYEIKKYVLAQDKYSWDRRYSVYVFKNDEFYGYIYNEKYDDDDSDLNHRILNNELDFAVKNLRLLDNETPRYWQYEDIK